MSETATTASDTAQTNDFLQADEGSGRPSQTATGAEADRPSEKKETFSPEDAYKDLRLPETLQGCEAGFASFKKLAGELKLPAETVQKLVEWESTATQEGQQNSQRERAEILQKWAEQTKQALGASYQQDIVHALQAAQRFGGPELRELLEVTGLGSHPVVVKTFHAIYQQTSEDVSVSGQIRHHTDKTFAEALYGKAL